MIEEAQKDVNVRLISTFIYDYKNLLLCIDKTYSLRYVFVLCVERTSLSYR